jgi:hypothetical protein
MSNQIVTIDPKQFGLEESKAANIAAQFQPMLDKMVELEKEYNEVINLPIEATETAKKAKELKGVVPFNPVEIEGNWYISLKEAELIDEFEIVTITINNNE